MKKSFLATAVLASVSLMGCITDDSSSGGSASVTNFGSGPINLTLKDQDPDRYVVLADSSQLLRLSEYSYCSYSYMDSSVSVVNSRDTSVQYYSLQGGQLTLWDSYSCVTSVYTGGTILEGPRWAYSGVAPLPAGFLTTNPECSTFAVDSADAVSESSMPENLSVQFQLSGGVYSRYYVYTNLCVADFQQAVRDPSTFEEDYPGVLFQKSDCNTYSFTLSDGSTATVDYQSVNSSTGAPTYTVSYKGTTCTMVSEQNIEATQATCEQALADWKADPNAETYFYSYEYLSTPAEKAGKACVESLGFPYPELLN